MIDTEHRRTSTDTNRIATWQRLILEGFTDATTAKRDTVESG